MLLTLTAIQPVPLLLLQLRRHVQCASMVEQNIRRAQRGRAVPAAAASTSAACRAFRAEADGAPAGALDLRRRGTGRADIAVDDRHLRAFSGKQAAGRLTCCQRHRWRLQ